jgi:hypothetical protein
MLDTSLESAAILPLLVSTVLPVMLHNCVAKLFLSLNPQFFASSALQQQYSE